MKKPPIEKVLASIGKLKILKILTINTEMNITAISKKTRLNHTRVNKHLQDLHELGIVMEKKFGRIKIYKINDNREMGCKIKDFIEYWINEY